MEGQNSIRAFDTKAQIVGIGYIFTIGIVTKIGAYNPNIPEFTPLLVILAWVLVMLPIIMFGAVLYPSRKTAPQLHEKTNNIKNYITYHLITIRILVSIWKILKVAILK